MGTLLLAEELFLLVHDDDSGKTTSWSAVDSGYAGALLLDLAAQDLIDTEEGKHVKVRISASKPDHPLLAAAYDEIAKSDKARKPSHWLTKLPSALRPLDKQIGGSLVERGVLSEEKKKVLGLFPSTNWPERDPAPERELRERLQGVLVKGVEPDLRTGLLISLLSPLDLVNEVVEKADRKEAKKRAKEIAESDLGGRATSTAIRQAVEAIQAAVLVSVIIPAVTISSS